MDKPKTLVSETKSKVERNCDELRTADGNGIPTCRVYKMIDGILVRQPDQEGQPEINIGIIFNSKNKRK